MIRVKSFFVPLPAAPPCLESRFPLINKENSAHSDRSIPADFITFASGGMAQYDMIKEGDIVKFTDGGGEIVEIQDVGLLGGDDYSVRYRGIDTGRCESIVCRKGELEKSEVIGRTGEASFSGDPEKFLLYVEAERIRSAYQLDPLFAVNCSIVDVLPHQVEAVYRYMLPQPRIRVMLADDTGAGKTIMTGLLLKEMVLRGRIKRILIVTPGGLTKQWQEEELGFRFNLSFKLVNREVLRAEPGVFQKNDRLVSSIDFICRGEGTKALKDTHWDMIVFDEAHRLSAYESGRNVKKSKRYDTALELSKNCEHLLLLTATPHRGREDTFKLLMQLLDADIFSSVESTTHVVMSEHSGDAGDYFIRRLKEDMKDWDNKPLYVKRHTRTVDYNLTSEEEHLYKGVTGYLVRRKEEAKGKKNVHVTLAMQVMQRRLASSIFAVRETLRNRYTALSELAEDLEKDPQLLREQSKSGDKDLPDIGNIDDISDFDDEEREYLDQIMSDPKKVRLFTTAENLEDIKKEAADVESLYDEANRLYRDHVEEQKLKELRNLLASNGIGTSEKLVIFTEYRDTLEYLKKCLLESGYAVGCIHGLMSFDDRREAQYRFLSGKFRILVCTDAAGEGINLQSCHILVNWDIPWNPNRLEQRMGRVHRYGQKHDVMVINMVAGNTREGHVLSKLLNKISVIREQLGNDRVYDVIQDVLKDVSLDDVIEAVFDGCEEKLSSFINADDADLSEKFRARISKEENAPGHARVDYTVAQELSDGSEQHRLQPGYVKEFFEKAFKFLGGKCEPTKDPAIYRMTYVPDEVKSRLKESYSGSVDDYKGKYFFFDKQRYIDNQLDNPAYLRAHYISPGNPLFDAVLAEVKARCREAALRGAILVSPNDRFPLHAFLVKIAVRENRASGGGSRVVDEKLSLVVQKVGSGEYEPTSPAKLLDMVPSDDRLASAPSPQPVKYEEVRNWSYANQSKPLLEGTKERVHHDTARRCKYIEESCTDKICEITNEISKLEGKTLGRSEGTSHSLKERREALMRELDKAKKRRQDRLDELNKGGELFAKPPEVISCAYIVPLGQLEHSDAHGMSRDDDVEAVAMSFAMDYELSHGRKPEDVSSQNLGFDIRSVSSDGITKRYIEVKGRSGIGGVLLSQNEYIRLGTLGERAWLYIVTDCGKEPHLHTFRNPVKNLPFDAKNERVTYLLRQQSWEDVERSGQCGQAKD